MLQAFSKLAALVHSAAINPKAFYRHSPGVLTDSRKQERVSASRDFLGKYLSMSDAFLRQIITGDELWLSYLDPETGQRRKTYCTLFWNRSQHLFVEFLPPEMQLTGEVYTAQVEKLYDEMKKHNRELFEHDRLLLVDNSSQHTCYSSRMMMHKCGFIQLLLPPYSPDLAPSDYHLFPLLRKHLKRRTLVGKQQLEYEVNKFLTGLTGEVYSEGLDSLVPRHQKCILAGGEYIENLN